MKGTFFIIVFFLSYNFLYSIEQEWIKTSHKEISFPEPEFKIENCPKHNDIIVSEIENPVKDVNQTDFSQISDISDDLNRESIINAIEKNIKYWENKPENFKVKIGQYTYSKDTLLKTSKRFIEIFQSGLSNNEILSILKKEFKIYRAISDDGTNSVTITGYYEAEIMVSKEKNNEYKFPLHLRPSDLIKTTPEMNVDFDYGRYDENGKLVKYYSTEDIRNGILDDKKLEISYSNHPSQIMLAQIQGSAILRYIDGDFIRIGFDGANGCKFKSVQKVLMDCGEIPSMSFKDFIKYLSSQPIEREINLVNLNPRYIFFKTKPKESLSYGAMGEELIPHRSIAIDPQYIPLGLIGYLKSKKPVSDQNGNLISFEKFSRFVTTQDTGSAIRGPGRIDLFWGNGKKAETESSSMKSSGEFYIFILK